LFQECTGRTHPPTTPPSEVYVVAGRRAGKSRFAGALAVRAGIRRYALAPGERATVAIAAADREQARILLGYAVAPFEENQELRGRVSKRSVLQRLSALVVRRTRWAVDLGGDVSIEVHTSNFGRIRGRTFALAIADELAFWSSEDGSNPASEVLAAIRPGLITVGGQLVRVSSPFAKSGPLWEAFERFYGTDDPSVLVWRAPSMVMNPSLPQAVIDTALARDEAAARAEWLAQFRDDLSSYITSR
jgi:hypothetical protein